MNAAGVEGWDQREEGQDITAAVVGDEETCLGKALANAGDLLAAAKGRQGDVEVDVVLVTLQAFGDGLEGIEIKNMDHDRATVRGDPELRFRLH